MSARSWVALALLGATLIGAADLRAFRRAFREAKRPARVFEERSAAFEAIEELSTLEAAEALVEAYLQLEAEVFEREEERRSYLARGFRDKRLEPRTELDPDRVLEDRILKRLERLKSAEVAEWLLSEALSNKKWPFTLRASVAARDPGPRSSDLLPKAAGRARKPEDVWTVLAALGRPAADGVAGEWVAGCLGHADAGVREAAAEASVRLRLPQAVEPLVGRIAVEEGRTRTRLAEALQALTGAGIGESAVAWRRWFEKEGAAFAGGERRLGEGQPVRRAARVGGPAYYGIPIDGRSTLFLFDRSKSMKKDVSEGDTRFTRAQKDLVRALGELREGTRFNIVAFGGTLDTYAEEMVVADEGPVAAAQEWINAMTMNLGTRLYDALDQAFVIAGRGIEDRYYDSSIDTIFVLTDGAPIINGKRDSKDRILSAVKRWNIGRRVVIHVVGVGKQVPKYLKKLAEDNGGKFIHKK